MFPKYSLLFCAAGILGMGVAATAQTFKKERSVSGTSTVRYKVWSPYPAIGVDFDSTTWQQRKDENNQPIFNGRMTGPQDQTQSPATPSKVVVAPLKKLACAVEQATDTDTWTFDKNGDGQISSDPADGERGTATDEVVQTWTCTGGGFVMQDEAGTETLVTSISSTDANFGQWTHDWKAPAAPGKYTVSCRWEDQAGAVPAGEQGSRDDGPTVRSADVVVYSASLRFLSSKVAAGGMEDAAHRSRYELRITDDQGIGLPAVSVPPPVVVHGGHGLFDTGTVGVQDDAVSAFATNDVAATDANGIVGGTFTSGKRASEPTSIMVPLNGDESGPQTPLIEQVWNELPPYREDNDDAWDYDDYFNFNTYSFITYRMAYNRDGVVVPITNHDLEFRTVGFSGDEWNSTIGFDWDGDDIVDGDYEHQEYSEDDEDTSGFEKWSGLVQWVQPTEEVPGSYVGWQDVTLNEDFIIDTVWFDVTDFSVAANEGVR